MPIIGEQIVARNIIKWGGGFVNQVNKAMARVATIMDDEVTRNMSLTDHTLKDLAALGHPYSRRSGGNLHEPNFQVHKQSGNLLESKQSGSGGASIEEGNLKATAFVRLDPGVAAYAPYIVYGTSKMIPRPVLSSSRDAVVPQILDFMRNELKNLKVG